MTVSHRRIAHLFVVNPPQLGRLRRRIFEKQFHNCPKPPPPISYIGVNKYHLDLSASKYRRFIKDQHGYLSRLKLCLRLEKNRQDFQRAYDSMFCLHWRGVTGCLPLGTIACTLSHIKVWERCCEMTDDVLCMVVEDDAVIKPTIEWDSVAWPQEADFLHLWSGAVYAYEKYSGDYVKMVQDTAPNQPKNSSLIGYIITPSYARRLRSEHASFAINRGIDMQLFHGYKKKGGGGGGNLFAVRQAWVSPMLTPSLIHCQSGLVGWLHNMTTVCGGLLPRRLRARYPLWLERQTTQFYPCELKEVASTLTATASTLK